VILENRPVVAYLDDLISIGHFAREHGALKQTVFKIAKRLGIEAEKRRSSQNRGQMPKFSSF
jgi:hypothetical protein